MFSQPEDARNSPATRPTIQFDGEFLRKHRISHRFMRTFHVEVFRDRMRIVDPTIPAEFEALPLKGYSTDRLLIGSPENAIQCLASALAERYKKSVHFRPYLQIQDMISLHHEISDLEYEVLVKVAFLSGASGVRVFDRLGNPVRAS